MIGLILRKVDDTLVVAVELEFLLPESQLFDERLHPNDFLEDFYNNHELYSASVVDNATTFYILDCYEMTPPA